MEHQSYAYGKNHWTLDPDLPQVLSRFWKGWVAHRGELERFGALAGGEAYRIADHVDKEARPVLVMHNLNGERIDRVRLSPAQEALNRELSAINRPPYQGGSWHLHYALGYLLADPGLYCIQTITNATIYAIHKYAPQFAPWKEALLSGRAFGATWMTEVQGGSDLGANRVRAVPEGAVWRLYGDKYFSSGAGLTDYALVSARPEGAPPGPKGVALFLVPRLDSKGGLNYRVRRLKDKLATRAVPSGEVEFEGAEAHLVGRAEEGIYYILETLTLSRLANAVGAMGLARKAQLEALFRARERVAFGRRLEEHPLFRRDLTDLAVRIAGGLALTFRAVAAWEEAWRETPPYSPRYHYARLLAHLAKARTAEHGTYCTQLAMELFGGVGFVEDFAIARLAREALITPIWEGPANVQALDTLEVLFRKGAALPFAEEFAARLEAIGSEEARLARSALESTLARLQTLSPEEAQWQAKEALRTLADAAAVALLYDLGTERHTRLAALYARHLLEKGEYPTWALEERGVWAPEEAIA
ncbi:MAG: acyl-CoA dehydrogenase family protein [Meiothermus sp.]|uniref:acyl-CoA dehydrogenase family protein n=1 Tax=Meiothermus sp. TaxID=1955249 RepID=UPI0025E91E34|nr:acyl-CoA dehydrogenase family protein [Meiothermus sp.]MCS7057314.1 acyl-CoA dehydrogenase family protein [Meiothermus sp.]MCS7194767.1 acyl-CoA dehydrogenase family protein [Meiothermus sp.]MDW8091252.1 acyl-CoA dehydrogenase family protein [Meiothermus sp.]MDW8480371.1 acyl-CoA dehydrogenase family protein [Meiothermus sp.]